MRTAKILSAGIILLMFASFAAFGLTDTANHDVTINVNEVASVGLNNTTLITLSTVAPATAGDDPTGQSDNGKTVQYTSLNDTGLSRELQAQISAATPAGTSLSLTAADPGGGNAGTTAGTVTLNTSAAAIITGIGSYATGGTGPVLTYQLNVVTVASLVVGASGTVTVTLTLAEDA